MKFPFYLTVTALYLAVFFPVFSDNIRVLKQNVWYEFVSFDSPTDHFTKNVFPHWEPETFQVFEEAKDPTGIAIDLGAWIGTTAIWLSKHFHHVLAVDADIVSLGCLKQNLRASDCYNVSICNCAISDKNGDVIFGPRGLQALNDSMSCIKSQPYHKDDYIVQSITLKQLIETNIPMGRQKISFIKCDIEGGEESILEDILNFVLENHCKAYISFHLDWWTSRNIDEFADLFRKFNTNCPGNNVCEYIKQNRFGSVYFY